MTTSASAAKLKADHDEQIRHMGELKPGKRERVLSQLEHVQQTEGGLPVFWFAPKGSKARGCSDHWVFVAPGEPLICSCDEVLYPWTMPEGLTLEAIVTHFAAVQS